MRTVINRSVSFDPQLFQQMESRRSRLMMQRSEYITRCILKDMIAGGDMTVEEVPASLVASPSVARGRAAKPAAAKKKKPRSG